MKYLKLMRHLAEAAKNESAFKELMHISLRSLFLQRGEDMIMHKMTMLLRNSLISYIAKFSDPNF